MEVVGLVGAMYTWGCLDDKGLDAFLHNVTGKQVTVYVCFGISVSICLWKCVFVSIVSEDKYQ
jgi:nicotinamidase-related amidase